MNICLIGASGHWGYALKGALKDENTKIIGVAPGSEGENVGHAFESICKAGFNPKMYDDYCKMLEELKPDVAVINCYFGDHAKVGQEALKRGCNVFMEKPVATTLEDLEKLKVSYIKSGKHLAGMFSLRYNAAFLTAFKFVRSGKIGDVRLIHAQKSYKLGTRGEHYKKRDTYGGTIPWVGSHAIDWVYWFSGEKFLSVYASHSKRYNQNHGDLETTAVCLFNMTNEVISTVNIDYLRPQQTSTHGDDRIRVVGTQGVIEVRDNKVFFTGSDIGETSQLELVPDIDIFCEFLNQIRGEGYCMISAEDSFYVTEACIRARIAADENKLVTF